MPNTRQCYGPEQLGAEFATAEEREHGLVGGEDEPLDHSPSARAACRPLLRSLVFAGRRREEHLAGKVISPMVTKGPINEIKPARTSGKCTQRSASMLMYCEPSPGKRKASLPCR